jgi:hypothetical protein
VLKLDHSVQGGPVGGGGAWAGAANAGAGGFGSQAAPGPAGNVQGSEEYEVVEIADGHSAATAPSANVKKNVRSSGAQCRQCCA